MAKKITGKQIGLVHVAKQKTGLTEVEYRDLLSSVGAASSKDLDQKTLDTVMQHFNALGFKTGGADGRARIKQKIRAVMAEMHLTDAYVNAMAATMFNLDHWAWGNAVQLKKLAAALTYHQRRSKKRQRA
ncbi:MAG: phage protein GemA/Gp16 family protein [Desulfobacterales bacterium]|nr:phage protein GemA/Gp16 family protein [Desulfobacterales bacterium]